MKLPCHFQWIEAFKKINEAIELTKTEGKKSGTIMAQFWGAHQRFFKYLCIASKVKHAVEAAKKAVEEGKCAVIGLQSTGEARTLEELDVQGKIFYGNHAKKGNERLLLTHNSHLIHSWNHRE